MKENVLEVLEEKREEHCLCKMIKVGICRNCEQHSRYTKAIIPMMFTTRESNLLMLGVKLMTTDKEKRDYMWALEKLNNLTASNKVVQELYATLIGKKKIPKCLLEEHAKGIKMVGESLEIMKRNREGGI